MLPLSDYTAMDAIALAEGVRQQRFSNTDLSNCAIRQAEAMNPAINAINIPLFEEAREQARLFDDNPELLNQSPVAGLPFLIKDLATIKSTSTSFGSKLYDGYVATRHSNIVRNYLDAGLIAMGKTNTPEFGLTITTEPVANGPVRNPWNLDYSTGGSSGGAAAAVASGIVPVAHASDGGGSIRVPASCCGLFGLKPSRGLTTVENSLSECWSGMSVGHVVSRSVRDSAAFLDLIKLDEPNLFAQPPAPASFYKELGREPGKLRIAVQLSHPLDQELDADCVEAVAKAARLCESLGHQLEELGNPIDYKPVVSAMNKMINVHAYQSVKARIEELGLDLKNAPIESSTRLMAQIGSQCSADRFLQARDTVQQAERQMAEFHNHFDLILSPVLAKTPAPLGWLDMNSDDMKEYGDRFRAYGGYTALFNGTGQPSMSVPLHLSDKGLPVGVMFSAAWGADSLLLRLARQLEQAQAWPLLAPMATTKD